MSRITEAIIMFCMVILFVMLGIAFIKQVTGPSESSPIYIDQLHDDSDCCEEMNNLQRELKELKEFR